MALIIEIKVVPRSSQNKIILNKNGKIVIHVKSPPENGKANKEVVKLLAKSLDLTQLEVEIISGHSFSLKRIKIHKSLTLNDVLNKLNLEIQRSLLK